LSVKFPFIETLFIFKFFELIFLGELWWKILVGIVKSPPSTAPPLLVCSLISFVFLNSKLLVFLLCFIKKTLVLFENKGSIQKMWVIARNTCLFFCPLTSNRRFFVHNFSLVFSFGMKVGMEVHAVVANIE